MKKFITITCLLPTLAGAQTLLTDHADITFSYDGAGWQSELRHGGTFDDPNTSTPLDQAALPAADLPFDSGDRYEQPASSNFDFTGVPDGEPLWILPRTDRGYTWPGFRNSQATSIFRSYDPQDSRVDKIAPLDPDEKWVTIQLLEVNYIGQSPSAHFSLWQIQDGIIKWMSTYENGIDASDVYYLKEQAHTHLDWGFSALGIYRISFAASATLDASGQVVTSSPSIVTFAIGSLATWQADHYTGAELENTSLSGPFSDSDKDGLQLILEYAFNLKPTTADAYALTPTTGTSGLPIPAVLAVNDSQFLQLEFIRRKSSTNPQITYTPQFSGTLNPASWTSGTKTSETSIDSTWERVIYTDSAAVSSNGQRFARVVVTLQESIDYKKVE